MNKKILSIISIILFIVVLVSLNIFLNSQNNSNIKETTNQINKENTIAETSIEILEVTSLNFNSEVLESEKTVLIDFYADWCYPCKILSPIVKEIAKENENIKVVKVDIDKSQDLAVKYEIMSIPTLVVIKKGQETNRVVGLVGKTEILNIINNKKYK